MFKNNKLIQALVRRRDKILAGRHNVEYPYPGRKLTGIVSVQSTGRKLCCHAYNETGYHEEIIENGTAHKEPIRASIRHYECRKCHRRVYVMGSADDRSIEKTLEKYRRERNTANA